MPLPSEKGLQTRRPAPIGTQFRFTSVEPIVEDGTRKVRFCFSDESVDRMGDSIKAAGWQYVDFLKNPVALWAHDSSSPPIGRASEIAVENTRLMGDIEFAAPGTYEFAETIFRLVRAGFISAVSVGFTPIEWKWVEDKDRVYGIDFLKQELLEISVVPIPANANALIEARRMGINVRPIGEWAERVLDGIGRVTIRQSELAALRKAAAVADARELSRAPLTKEETDPNAGGYLIDPNFAKSVLDSISLAGGMGEDDPSSGGFTVGNCGREADEECGMKDPAECSIHSDVTKEDEDEEMDEKAITALVGRQITAATKSIVAEVVKAVTRMRKDDGEPDGDETSGEDEDRKAAHHVHLKGAHFHMKEATRCLRKAMDTIDDEGIIDPAESNPEGETGKALREARAASLRVALAS